jgi:hypothetical protein
MRTYHPIRNDFNEKDCHWITNQYQPKSFIIDKIAANDF